MTLDFTDICGYIDFVSNVKQSKNGKPYFEVVVVGKNDEQKVVCFNIDLLRRSKAVSGCSLNRVIKSGNDYLFTDDSSLEECEVRFEKKSFHTEPTTLLDVVNKSQLYDKVTIVIKVLTVGEIF